MLDPKKNYTEFTPPLEEFPPLEDKPSAIDAPEFAPPESEFPFVEDKPARITAPEITEPGRFQWENDRSGEEHKTFRRPKFLLGAQMLSAFSTVCPFQPMMSCRYLQRLWKSLPRSLSKNRRRFPSLPSRASLWKNPA